jgi:hypothetical protein
MLKRYRSWVIDEEKAHNPEGITVILNADEFLWGWWPSEPEMTGPLTVVTGICFFDARWGLKFKHPKPGQEGTWRSLALRSGRDKSRELLARGREIEYITIPPFPTLYVKKMLSFQRLGLEKLGGVVERVLYHIPFQEYLQYSEMLPYPWKSRMKAVLQEEAKLMAELIRNQLAKWPIEIHWGGKNPPQSFVDLYLRAIEGGGIVIGLEELVELRLPFEVSRQTGMTIPTIVGVLDIPHPYYLDHQSQDDEVIVIEL